MTMWMGSTACDFCGKEITDKLVDGKTVEGPWAVMCPHCFTVHGVGLGIGKGQKYALDCHGNFVKVETKSKKDNGRSLLIAMAMAMGMDQDEAEMEVDDYLV